MGHQCPLGICSSFFCLSQYYEKWNPSWEKKFSVKWPFDKKRANPFLPTEFCQGQGWRHGKCALSFTLFYSILQENSRWNWEPEKKRLSSSLIAALNNNTKLSPASCISYYLNTIHPAFLFRGYLNRKTLLFIHSEKKLNLLQILLST